MNVSEDLLWRIIRKEVCYVYRLFNSDDELIYVGITSDIPQRFSQHRCDKDWWPEVVHQEVWTYRTRDEALAVEHALIHALHPRYNTAPGQSPAIRMKDNEMVVETPLNPGAHISTRERRTWIHEQLDCGVELTGAMIDRQFPNSNRNGARLLKSVLAERADLDEDEDSGEENLALCEEAADPAPQDAPHAA